MTAKRRPVARVARPTYSKTRHCCWPMCTVLLDRSPAPLCGEHLVMAWVIAGTQIDNIRDQAAAMMPRDVYIPRAAPRDPPPQQGMVYFLRFGNRVKIGFTTNLPLRLQALPHDEVLATMPGTMLDEKRCHAAFAHLRETGEWFRAEPDLLAFTADLQQEHVTS